MVRTNGILWFGVAMSVMFVLTSGDVAAEEGVPGHHKKAAVVSEERVAQFVKDMGRSLNEVMAGLLKQAEAEGK